MKLTISPYRSSSIDIASRRARRARRWPTLAACALTVLAAPAVASAADTVIAPDPAADELAALDGTVVWVSGKFGHQVLMERTAAGTIRRVTGAPEASAYRTIDLGHDRKGRLVLTYERCYGTTCEKAYLDNLQGQRASYKHLTLKRCSLSTAPAVWGTRLVYGLSCRKPNKQIDANRSGLYLKSGTKSPTRMRMPGDSRKFAITNVNAVDVRGTRVAAIVADVYEYAFTETVSKTGLRSIFAAGSEGDSDEHAMGVSLGTGGTMWSLTDAEHNGDPNQAIIFRVAPDCLQTERFINPAGPSQEDGYLASDLAVDGSKLYLVVPAGITSHAFTPEAACKPL